MRELVRYSWGTVILGQARVFGRIWYMEKNLVYLMFASGSDKYL